MVEKGWIGGGNTGRNTTIIRSNYLFDESIAIYEHSLKLWEGLSQALNYNVMYSPRGVMMLAHSVHDVQVLKRILHANRANGVDNEWLTPEQAKAYCPPLDISANIRYPVLGATLQRRGGTARHDAVAWGYARAADALGVDILENCEVTGIRRGAGGAVEALETVRGLIRTPKVGVVAAGNSSVVMRMAGIRLPLESYPLQALVSEPVKPVFPCVVMSNAVHAYINQSDKGELVIGAGTDAYTSYTQRGGLHVDEHTLEAICELFPCFRRLRMLRNCTAARYELNKGRMVRLAEYSRDCLKALRAETGIAYDERMQGTLQLFRTQKQLDGTGADVEVLRRSGVPYELLDAAGCERVEPALARVRGKFVGGLRLPGDETGDCFKFTQNLAKLAAARGVTFRQDTTIERIEQAGGRITGVVTSAGTLTADAYLLALGSHSPTLLAPLGIHIPVYPVKGYSITVPITDASGAPESTVMDETHKVAVTRLGDRIRVGGTAELAGYTLKLHEARRRTLEHVVTDLFPAGGDVARAEFWCGLRPMTPDGTPASSRKACLCGYNCSSRLRELVIPTPSRNAPADGKPQPLSVTTSINRSPVRAAEIVMTPFFRGGASPCFTQFSTSGCRKSAGTNASSASGVTAISVARRSPNRTRSISRYARTKSSSSASLTSCRPMLASVRRSNSLRRLTIRSAPFTSSCIIAEMVCSVLNRKCGCSCDFSTSSWSCATCLSRS